MGQGQTSRWSRSNKGSKERQVGSRQRQVASLKNNRFSIYSIENGRKYRGLPYISDCTFKSISWKSETHGCIIHVKTSMTDIDILQRVHLQLNEVRNQRNRWSSCNRFTMQLQDCTRTGTQLSRGSCPSSSFGITMTGGGIIQFLDSCQPDERGVQMPLRLSYRRGSKSTQTRILAWVELDPRLYDGLSGRLNTSLVSLT